ncbi:MAG TPA: hypothetical protein VMV69_03775 [Pirellulales bacterium]|nr:hypothetical protein [Pirellulales bacterium]
MHTAAIETGQRRVAMVFGVTQTVRVLEASSYGLRQWVCTLEPAGTTMALDETELGELIAEPDATENQGLRPLPRSPQDETSVEAKPEGSPDRSEIDDDLLMEASEESFPASDPPASTSSTALSAEPSHAQA